MPGEELRWGRGRGGCCTPPAVKAQLGAHPLEPLGEARLDFGGRVVDVGCGTEGVPAAVSAFTFELPVIPHHLVSRIWSSCIPAAVSAFSFELPVIPHHLMSRVWSSCTRSSNVSASSVEATQSFSLKSEHDCSDPCQRILVAIRVSCRTKAHQVRLQQQVCEETISTFATRTVETRMWVFSWNELS